MVIITNKSNGVIIAVGKKLTPLSSGYPSLDNSKVGYEPQGVNVFNYDGEVSNSAIYNYCYDDENGLYRNPLANPYGIPNETINAIIDDYTDELIEMGVL